MGTPLLTCDYTRIFQRWIVTNLKMSGIPEVIMRFIR